MEGFPSSSTVPRIPWSKAIRTATGSSMAPGPPTVLCSQPKKREKTPRKLAAKLEWTSPSDGEGRTDSGSGRELEGSSTSPTRSNGMARMARDDVDSWDPMSADYSSPSFNSYTRGPGVFLQSSRESNPQGNISLFVNHIPLSITKEGLRNLFSRAGNVKGVNLVKPSNPNHTTTYGFVQFGTVQEADSAMQKLNQFDMGGGVKLAVKVAEGQEQRQKRLAKKREEEVFLNTLNCAKHGSEAATMPAESTEFEMNDEEAEKNQKNPFLPRYSPPKQHTPSGPAGVTSSGSPGPSSLSSSAGASSLRAQPGTIETDTSPTSLGGSPGQTGFSSSPGAGETSYSIPSPSKTDPPPSAPQHLPCSVCEKPCVSKCSRCKTPYCSQVCQRKDWTRHKSECKLHHTDSSLEVKTDPQQTAATSKSSPGTDGPLKIAESSDDEGVHISIPSDSELDVIREYVYQVRQARERGTASPTIVTGFTGAESAERYQKVGNTHSPEMGGAKCAGTKTQQRPDSVQERAISSLPRRVSFADNAVGNLKQSGAPIAPSEGSSSTELHIPLSEILSHYKHPSFPLASVPLESPLPLEFNAIITSVISASRFSVTVLSVETKQALLKLEKFGEGLLTPVNAAELTTGSKCGLKLESGEFCRGEVVRIPKEHIFVRLFDFGGHLNLPDKDLFCLPEDIVSFPSLRYRCSLLNIFTNDSIEGAHFLLELVKGRVVRVRMHGIKKTKVLQATVVLCDVTLADGSVNIGEVVRNSQFATTQPVGSPSPTKPWSKQLDNSASAKRDSVSSKNDSVDSPYKMVHFANRVPIHSPPRGEKFEIFPTVVSSPSVIWAQVVHQNIGYLHRMQKDLNFEYSHSKNTSYTPTVGEICAAKFSEDQCYYRAEVLCVNHDGTVDVRYVDFGNRQTITVAQLHHLKPIFISLPKQALHFSLAGITPVGSNWSDNTIAYLKDKIMNRKVPVEITSESPITFFVKLYDPESPKQLVNNALVALGHAQEVKQGGGREPLLRSPVSPMRGVSISHGNASPSVTSPTSRFEPPPLSDSGSSSHQGSPVKQYSIQRPSTEGERSHHLDLRATDMGIRQDLSRKQYTAETSVQQVIPVLDAPPQSSKAGKTSLGKQPGNLGFPESRQSAPQSGSNVPWGRFAPPTTVEPVTPPLTPPTPNDETAEKQGLLGRPPILEVPRGLAPLSPGILGAEPSWGGMKTASTRGKEATPTEMLKTSPSSRSDVFTKQTSIASEMMQATSPIRSQSQAQTQFPPREERILSPTTQRGGKEAAKRKIESTRLAMDSDSVRVLVTFVEDPQHFWVQVVEEKNLRALLAVSQKMNESPLVRHPNPQAGDLCVCRYSADGSFYRSRVNSVNNSVAKVQFIDYGNQEQVSLSEIYEIEEELLALPAQAVFCTLNHLLNPSGKSAPWKETDTEFFKSQVSDEKTVTLKFVRTLGIKNIVELKVEEMDLLQLLVEAGHGSTLNKSSMKSNSQRPRGDSSPQKDHEGGKQFQQRKSPFSGLKARDGPPDTPSSKPIQSPFAGFRAKSMEQTDRGNNEAGGRLKPKSPFATFRARSSSQDKQRDDLLDKPWEDSAQESTTCVGQGSSSEQTCPNISQLVTLELPSTSDYFEVVVLEVYSPHSLFLQIATRDSVKTLESISQGLSTHFQSNRTPVAQNPEKGSLCCAKFSQDGQWYRAEVLERLPACCVVQFVDFGNTDTVPLTDIAPCPSELLPFPKIAVQCALNGVSPLRSDRTGWSMEATSFLKQKCCERLLLAKVVGSNPHTGIPLLELVDTSSELDINMAVELVENGFAISESAPQLPTSGHASLPAARTSDVGASHASLSGARQSNFPLSQPTPVPTAIRHGPIPPPQVSIPCSHLPESTLFRFQVTDVTDPGSFHGQLNLRENFLALNDMMNEIQVVYSDPSQYGGFTLSPGAFCCAKYEADGCFYRSKVIEVSGRTAKLQYIDFGNIECVSCEKVFALDPKFATLPSLAVHCSLSDVTPVSGACWTSEAMAKFKSLIDSSPEGILTARVTESGGGGVPVGIELYLGEQGTKSVGNMLIQLRLASPPPQLLSPPSKSLSTSGPPPFHTSQPQFQTSQPTQSPPVPASSLPGVVLPSSNEFFVLVTHTNSLADFYIQVVTQENLHVLMSMMKRMNEYCSSVEACSRLPTSGELCLAMYSDGNWFRAEVLHQANQDSAEVFFVDFGNKECVSLREMRPIAEEFLTLPVQAVQCGLYGLPASEVLRPSSSTHEAFSHLISNAPRLLCQVISPCPLIVDLKDEGSLTGSVRDNLTQMGLVPTLDDLGMVAMATSSLPRDKNSIVMVMEATDPTDFWLQVGDQTTLTELSKTSQKMQGYCLSAAPLADPPVLGQLCCAKFSLDGTWYRARVANIVSETTVKVLFIDFGNTDVVQLSALRSFNRDFVYVPAQGVHCCLVGFEAARDLSSEVVQKFKGLVEDKQLIATLKGSCGVYKTVVELVDTSGDTDVYVHQQLN